MKHGRVGEETSDSDSVGIERPFLFPSDQVSVMSAQGTRALFTWIVFTSMDGRKACVICINTRQHTSIK
eukprot:m.566709 g.566709  ORF g.566709 m.566709 type:complete len:69 (-) comp22253_c0_seq16:1799-2005(-)